MLQCFLCSNNITCRFSDLLKKEEPRGLSDLSPDKDGLKFINIGCNGETEKPFKEMQLKFV
jgi:hypothetical protein